jgi:biotin-dependent carboxylase-like uncharacterized protein
MSPALRVISPGLLTTVQDLGRPGYQHLGVPVGGALDAVSLRAANALVGNVPQTGALEVAYVGPTLVVEADAVRLSFVGAQAPIDIYADEGATTGTRIGMMRTVRLRRGQALRVGSLSGGTVLYIAVEGGFAIEPIFRSVATYIRGGFGGWQGRALKAGDLLPLICEAASEREDVVLHGLDLTQPRRLRVIPGPQSDYFSPAGLAGFFDNEYAVCAGSNRMAMRLAGPAIQHMLGYNIPSDATAPGSIQVPGDGQPIVLLADRQTTGGYPKIATVISADLPALARLPIGAQIRFVPVTTETAIAARRKLVADITGFAGRIKPLPCADVEVRQRLLDCNLISGAVDAHAA